MSELDVEREVVLDLETTGLSVQDKHRIIQVGLVELSRKRVTGRELNLFINPQRDVPLEAQRVHGITSSFLSDKPLFREIAETLLAFLGDSPLVIHNAPFDMSFLNAELSNIGYPPIPMSRTIDTLRIAKERFPGAKNSLDALCKRYRISLENRSFHGALVDAQLLAHVYRRLCGIKDGMQQGTLAFNEMPKTEAYTPPQKAASPKPELVKKKQPLPEARSFPATSEEVRAHTAFIERIPNPIWKKEEA